MAVIIFNAGSVNIAMQVTGTRLYWHNRDEFRKLIRHSAAISNESGVCATTPRDKMYDDSPARDARYDFNLKGLNFLRLSHLLIPFDESRKLSL